MPKIWETPKKVEKAVAITPETPSDPTNVSSATSECLNCAISEENEEAIISPDDIDFIM